MADAERGDFSLWPAPAKSRRSQQAKWFGFVSVIHQGIAEEGKVMKEIKLPFKSIAEAINSATAVLLCLALISSADPVAFATAEQSQAPAAAADAKIPNDQLDSLVAPIALYPDPLVIPTKARMASLLHRYCITRTELLAM